MGKKGKEIAGKVVEHYNNIINKVKDADYVTFEIVGDKLSEEVMEAQDLEDILTKLEI